MTIHEATQLWLYEGGLSEVCVRILLALPEWLNYDDFKPLKYGLISRRVMTRSRDGELRPINHAVISKAMRTLIARGYLLRVAHPKLLGRSAYVYMLAVPRRDPAVKRAMRCHFATLRDAA